VKLPRIQPAGKTIKITFTIPEKEADLIADYANYYTSIYNETLPHGELARHIIKTFINSDKEFLKFQKNNNQGLNLL
jgi:hypothetical protein